MRLFASLITATLLVVHCQSKSLKQGKDHGVNKEKQAKLLKIWDSLNGMLDGIFGDIDMPDMPDIDLPSIEMPDIDLPSVEMPDLPSVEMPDLPSVEIPDEIDDAIDDLWDWLGGDSEEGPILDMDNPFWNSGEDNHSTPNDIDPPRPPPGPPRPDDSEEDGSDYIVDLPDVIDDLTPTRPPRPDADSGEAGSDGSDYVVDLPDVIDDLTPDRPDNSGPPRPPRPDGSDESGEDGGLFDGNDVEDLLDRVCDAILDCNSNLCNVVSALLSCADHQRPTFGFDIPDEIVSGEIYYKLAKALKHRA